MKTITATNGITYEVIKRTTPETMRAEGLTACAAHMEENGRAAELILRRPKGRKHFYAVESAAGAVSIAWGV